MRFKPQAANLTPHAWALRLGSWVFLILLFASCSREEGPSASLAPRPPRPSPAAGLSAPPPPTSPKPEKKPVYTYDPKGRRDPFQPLIVAKPPKPKPKSGLGALDVNELKLAGVVWEDRAYYALVEVPNGLGYVIRTGDVIGDGAKVVKITKDSVIFEVKGRFPRQQAQKVTLQLRKEE